jgi:hypothetical protein
LFEGATWWTKLRMFFQRLFGRTLLDRTIESFIEQIQHHIRMLLTAHLMTLTIPPGRCLHLGQDLSAPFPADLKTLTDPDLTTLLKQIDPTPDSVVKSGATDWANLSERMHYIADLFRCFHESKEIFDAAFATEQIEAIKQGKLPEGSL